MKKLLKVGALILAVMLVSTGCSNSESKEPQAPKEPAQILYPVSIDGNDIILGETTVQKLLDQGLKVTFSETTPDGKIEQFEVDPEVMLDADSYYSGGTVWISEKVFAHIAMITNEKAIRMGDSIIARLEFSLVSAEPETLEKIAFNGVTLDKISRTKAGEMFPDFTGDDYLLLQYGSDYEYTLSFDQESAMINKLSITKEYDVDWNAKG